jgi:hypothetical protein
MEVTVRLDVGANVAVNGHEENGHAADATSRNL